MVVLPEHIVHKICILTGKFAMRYDVKTNKLILVNRIDMSDDIWVNFNRQIKKWYIKKYKIFNYPSVIYHDTNNGINIYTFGFNPSVGTGGTANFVRIV